MNDNFGKLVDTIETPTFPLFVYANPAGGRTYVSGEVGQVIWDTALGDKDLLDLALVYEELYEHVDRGLRKNGRSPKYSFDPRVMEGQT